jgi:hypothetical protein
VDVFFVCGAPKSGTTWLQRILDEHPEVSCAGEGHFIDRFAIPMAAVVSRYNQEIALETEQVYEGRPYYSPVPQAAFDALARGFIAQRLVSRGPAAEVRWVGDKTPRYTQNLVDLNRLFPEARFFHIVRDPRDVAVSHLAHSYRAGVERAFSPEAPEHRELLGHVIEGWLQAIRAVDAFAEAHPGRVHELRYRDLHANPHAEIARAFGFLGVDQDAALIEKIAAATSFEALSGRKPGAEDLAAFLRKGVPGDWRGRLDPEAAARIVEACGPWMRQKRFLDAPRDGQD